MILRIVLLGALAVAAIWVANRPGRVQIDWLDYRIELSLAGLVLLLLLLVALLLLLGRLWRYLRPGFWRERTLARQRRGYEELTWGLSALAAGDASLARKHARKFAQLTGNSALSDLLEGQAALLEGDLQTAKLKFSGLRGDKRSEALGLRGLLSVASRQGDEREALDLANDALKR
ncbi:MAG: heme biosynthesis HemY N-terminal domain-containing protein, partial [Alphaproteobacteria bacterium]|nr:heme biosynthesis HemY N-terminal domain-containing protein [Alphaproteobacteria bacterium]